MSLTSSLNIAQSSLSTRAEQTSVLSRNVANVGDPNAARRSAEVVSTGNGGVRVGAISRAGDQALLENMHDARSAANANAAMLSMWDRLERTIGDPELGLSPQAKIGQLSDALQVYASAPHDAVRANASIEAARDVVSTLHSASSAVQSARGQADLDIEHAVQNLNNLLSQFHEVNTSVVNATRAEVDATDFLDERDRILGEITAEVGIRTTVRADQDMAIYTDSGVPLFDKIPRRVDFNPSGTLAPGTMGNAVYVDGLPVTGDTAVMPVHAGRIAGLTEARDIVSVTYQSQLDEIARGLIVAFSETDQSATPTQPAAAGLFTYSGSPTVPAVGFVVHGLAMGIEINASVDPQMGGDPKLIRDGGASNVGNPAYVYNTTGAAGFTGRLEDIVEKLGSDRAFDISAGGIENGSIAEFAGSSVSWLEAGRQAAQSEQTYRTTLYDRSAEALSNAIGTNLDEELSLLLDLERTYQASTLLISTIDEMFNSLLVAT